MPTYAHGPRILKGAIVAISETNPQPQTIAFLYNPETVKRSLQPQTAGGDQGERSQAVRYIGAPIETIELEVYIDAIDALECLSESDAKSALRVLAHYTVRRAS